MKTSGLLLFIRCLSAKSGSHNLGPKAGRRSRRAGAEAASVLLMLQRGKIQRTPPEKHGFSDVMRVPSIKFRCAWKHAAHANVHMQDVKQTGDIRDKRNGVMTPSGMETLRHNTEEPSLGLNQGEQVLVNLS